MPMYVEQGDPDLFVMEGRHRMVAFWLAGMKIVPVAYASKKITEDSYTPPTLHTGDKILKGKFKNSPAEIKGFKKDKHNQPVLKTNKGDMQLFKPRVTKLMTESMLPGTYIHETSPEMAAQIAKTGFKPSYEGIFFNRDGTGYSGGGYGEAQIEARLNIDKLLDMTGDLSVELEELADTGDGEEIAGYARKHGYQAWADDLQIAVLDPRCIKIVGIK